MYSFFVLGLVPGTNFQISFTMWLQSVEAVVIAVLLVKLGSNFIIAGRQDLVDSAPARVSFPAKLLHR